MRTQGTARIPPQARRLHEKYLPTVTRLLLRLRHYGFELRKAFQPKYAPTQELN